MSSAAAYFDIQAEEDCTYDVTATWKNSSGGLINLTGATAKMEIRDKPGGTIKTSLTESSGITLGGVNGTIQIKFVPAYFGQFVYDLIVTLSSGDIERVLEGEVIVDRTVTEL